MTTTTRQHPGILARLVLWVVLVASALYAIATIFGTVLALIDAAAGSVTRFPLATDPFPVQLDDRVGTAVITDSGYQTAWIDATGLSGGTSVLLALTYVLGMLCALAVVGVTAALAIRLLRGTGLDRPTVAWVLSGAAAYFVLAGLTVITAHLTELFVAGDVTGDLDAFGVFTFGSGAFLPLPDLTILLISLTVALFVGVRLKRDTDGLV